MADDRHGGQGKAGAGNSNGSRRVIKGRELSSAKSKAPARSNAPAKPGNDAPARGATEHKADRARAAVEPHARPTAGRSASAVTPSRRAAYDALHQVLRKGAYSGLALDGVLSEMRLSAADRALATEMFYGTLDNLIRIDWALGKLMERAPEGEVQDVLRMAAYQLLYLERVPANAACDEAVRLARSLGYERATGLVNGVLRNLLRRKSELTPSKCDLDPVKHMSIAHSMPEFVCQRLVDQYGEAQAEAILAWRGERFTVLRPNVLRISQDGFERALDAAKLNWQRSPVPGAYRVTGLGAIARQDIYKRGLCSVQGESSLMCALALDPRPGMQLMDACAAPGGKSAALIELMQGSGRVYACDIHAHRVELIRAMSARLGHDGIKARQWDATRFNPEWEGAMDAVLCDAPCSGLGVVSSKPDIKLNITPEALEQLPELQARILANCARYVRPGGVLVYSTCTILASENQDVVNGFLRAHGEFGIDDVAPHVPESFRGAVQDGMLALLGCRDGVDGFFVARMVRR